MENILPEGYRFRTTFLLFPTEIAGRRRWLESVRYVERVHRKPLYGGRHDCDWDAVGYWDEVFPALTPTKDATGFPEL